MYYFTNKINSYFQLEKSISTTSITYNTTYARHVNLYRFIRYCKIAFQSIANKTDHKPACCARYYNWVRSKPLQLINSSCVYLLVFKINFLCICSLVTVQCKIRTLARRSAFSCSSSISYCQMFEKRMQFISIIPSRRKRIRRWN